MSEPTQAASVDGRCHWYVSSHPNAEGWLTDWQQCARKRGHPVPHMSDHEIAELIAERQVARSELPGAAMTQPSTPVHTFTEWRYRGMGESDRLCLTCDYLQNGHEPDDEVPPCRNAGYPQAPEPARKVVCIRCGLVLFDGLHRSGSRECFMDEAL